KALHEQMRCNSDELACNAVFRVINKQYEKAVLVESQAQLDSEEGQYQAEVRSEQLKEPVAEEKDQTGLKTENTDPTNSDK
ncbi:MAG: hypothetical protein ACI4ND_01165, partial [Succinivibrio sp.]